MKRKVLIEANYDNKFNYNTKFESNVKIALFLCLTEKGFINHSQCEKCINQIKKIL